MTDTTVEVPTLDPVQAHQEASRRMRKVRDVLEGRRVVEESAKAQLAEITIWRDQELERFDREVTRLREEMRPYVAALVASEPMGRKSVEMVAGRAGFRAGRERVIVDDSEAALAYIAEHSPDCIRVTRVLDIPTLKRTPYLLAETPGIRIEKGEEQFYVDPIAAP